MGTMLLIILILLSIGARLRVARCARRVPVKRRTANLKHPGLRGREGNHFLTPAYCDLALLLQEVLLPRI